MPTDTRSPMDPSVKFTIKHADGSLCRHKKTWAFYNREPPPKNYELPDLFDSDTTMTLHSQPGTPQKYNLRSTKPDKNIALVNINTCLDDSNNSLTVEKGDTTERTIKSVKQRDDAAAAVDVNTENVDDIAIEGTENKRKI